MFQAANTEFFSPLVLKLTIAGVKIYYPFTNEASKSQLKLVYGFAFFAPSALMG